MSIFRELRRVSLPAALASLLLVACGRDGAPPGTGAGTSGASGAARPPGGTGASAEFPCGGAEARPLTILALGLSHLEMDRPESALDEFRTLAAERPADPAGPADAAVAALRLGRLPEAEQLAREALRRAPGHPASLSVLALILESDGRAAEASEARREAVRRAPEDPRVLWEAAADTGVSDSERAQALASLRKLLPGNAAVLVESLRAASRTTDAPAARAHVAALRERIPRAPAGDAELDHALAEAIASLGRAGGKWSTDAGRAVIIVANLVRGSDAFREDLRAVQVPIQGRPVERLTDEGGGSIPPPGESAEVAVSWSAAADDRAAECALPQSAQSPPAPAGAGYSVAADLDHDGDLDLFVGVPRPSLLRNNGDGTTQEVLAAWGLGALGRDGACASAVSADLDGDIDLDLAAACGGRLRVFENLRRGRFQDVTAAWRLEGPAGGVDAGDLDGDGRTDLVVAATAGSTAQSRALLMRGRSGAETRDLPAHGAVVLLDADNDGDLDAASADGLSRNDGRGQFRAAEPLPAAGGAPARLLCAADLDGDGDADIALAGGGWLRNDGGNRNAWLSVSLLTRDVSSGRVNPLGIGSRIEVRAGALYMSRTARAAATLIGLGTCKSADVVRVTWTNGVPQSRTAVAARTSVTEQEVLKGSCPFLYARSGGATSFVTDLLWNAPLGMPGGPGSTAPYHDEELLFLDGVPPSVDPPDLVVTEELWEIAYLDRVALVAVDHPEGFRAVSTHRAATDPRPPLGVETVGVEVPVSAQSLDGRDITGLLARADGRHERGRATRMQGLMEEHGFVIQLPGGAAAAPRLVLFFTGWMHPGDSTIRTASMQGRGPPPVMPVLEAPDGRGGWRAIPGTTPFPAGKTKTFALDLTGRLPAGADRLRFRTSLDVRTDRVFLAVGEPRAPMRRTELAPASASLHYRGFSRNTLPVEEGPMIPDYATVETSSVWPQVGGPFTRYGPVEKLLGEKDSRMVVMGPGDAVDLRFNPAGLPPLPAGWRRDWMLYSSGFDKDCDLNTWSGAAAGPLPYVGMPGYPFGPGTQYPEAHPPSDAAYREYLREYMTREDAGAEFPEAVRAGAVRAVDAGGDVRVWGGDPEPGRFRP